jgi:antitoxin (DNA-binding transcriptional repressor) of toxin-antitoxin stability system
MEQVHMSEAEVASDFAAVLYKIQGGAEVIVDRNGQPIAIIKSVQPEPSTFSRLIGKAEKREKERGYAITLDPGYAADVEQIVHPRKPWLPRSWE